MNPGEVERIVGYIAERSVERFMLLNGWNGRLTSFEYFDLTVDVGHGRYLRCQVKGTATGKRFNLRNGRNRRREYEKGSFDFYCLVTLDTEYGQDGLFFLLPEDISTQSIAVKDLKTSWQGLHGWNRVRNILLKRTKHDGRQCKQCSGSSDIQESKMV